MKFWGGFLIFLLFWTFWSCVEKTPISRFTLMPSAQTGIDFVNTLEITQDFDVFRYRNFYNGGGVALGDINRDGLTDIMLTSNMGDNKLYLNKGDWKFEDISVKAGINGNRVWSTGVSMADVNGDGWLDIYVCNSGDVLGANRENELFINNRDLTFTERAREFGLNDKGFGTHAAFFDYDQDGDLDCYVLNNSFRPVSSLGLENIRHVRDSTGGDKLYKNIDGKYYDVSEEAGIYGSVIGFGLGVTVTDVNIDGWPDIYVSNDFFERDYLYINQKSGKFSEELELRMGHISNFSMGADAADLDNDGSPDIFVTDMLPESEHRIKTMVSYEPYDKFQLKLRNGYYEQYMRNTLQRNDGRGVFKEIGQFAGVYATDWSWGAVMADFDNDGNKEIFVANGIYKDVTNQDFIDFLASDEMLIPAMRSGKVDFQSLVDKMPSSPLPNYLFKMTSGLKYENVAREWGVDTPSFSNGAAYGDLDNDGDLDLVVNNVNQNAFVYRNNTDLGKSLKLELVGAGGNSMAVGARVVAYSKGRLFSYEHYPTKGFQSSMDYRIVIGCDSVSRLDSVKVYWGYGRVSTLYQVDLSKSVQLNFSDAVAVGDLNTTVRPGKPVVRSAVDPPFLHREDSYVDFDFDRLLYHKLSTEGPALAVADVNRDGLDDFYIGGAAGQSGAVYLQTAQGRFVQLPQADIDRDKAYEDVDAVFFDADGDNDLDLYVVSGGFLAMASQIETEHRLYINDSHEGKVKFTRARERIPFLPGAGSCVRPADFDSDGDVDLFVGGRAIVRQYGIAADSYLLENDGKGRFVNSTNRTASRFFNMGMVTDAHWFDWDRDRDLDLVVVGEWMGVTLFKNNGTNLERLNNIKGLTNTQGWWNCVGVADLNADGFSDLLLGNWGLNSMFRSSAESPLTLFVSDFDSNGTLDPIFAQFRGDSLYPIPVRNDLIKQLPGIKKKYLFHKDYAGKTVSQVFSPKQLNEAQVRKVFGFESVVAFGRRDGSFELTNMPRELQYAPLFSFAQLNDSTWFCGGNFFGVKPEEGRYDANFGALLRVTPGGVLEWAGDLGVRGEVRKAKVAQGKGGKKFLILAKNNDYVEVHEF